MSDAPPVAPVDCLTFFLVSSSPDGSSALSPSALAVAVGAQPPAHLPPRRNGSDAGPLPNVSSVEGRNASGLLGAVLSNWCELNNLSLVSAPFFAARAGGGPGGAAVGKKIGGMFG